MLPRLSETHRAHQGAAIVRLSYLVLSALLFAVGTHLYMETHFWLMLGFNALSGWLLYKANT